MQNCVKRKQNMNEYFKMMSFLDIEKTEVVEIQSWLLSKAASFDDNFWLNLLIIQKEPGHQY